jgi:demethylmenaquinone methyltransferase/2-methoxy-6-polyprenyl-1,4-benzoquinol methylase
MLEIAAEKLRRRGIGNIELIEGNAEALPVPSNSFQAATIGFTLRNVGNIENALAEMTRAVEPGGRVVILELAEPTGPVFRAIYHAYFHRLLPLIGGVVSGMRGAGSREPPLPIVGEGVGLPPPHHLPGGESNSLPNDRKGGTARPYDYLPASVASFVSREELKAAMENVGLADVRVYDLTAGIVAVHVGIKP